MNVIDEALSKVRIGSPTAFRNLTIVPFVATSGTRDYLTLDEALGGGAATVTEISEEGHVPELQFSNNADQGILLLDGEELVGAKQNRILNMTVLAPAHLSLRIPVSCVEAGRWRRQSREFRASPRTHYASGRAMKLRDVSRSMNSTADVGGTARRSDQSAVWSDIDQKMSRLKGHSATHAMSDMFEHHAPAIEAYVQAFQPLPSQSGAAFLINGRLIGMDVFDTDEAFTKLFHKLIRSYALDAIDDAAAATQMKAGNNPVTQVSNFFKAISSASCEAFKAIGEGEDLRFSTGDVCGAALHARNRIIHLTAFVVAAPSQN